MLFSAPIQLGQLDRVHPRHRDGHLGVGVLVAVKLVRHLGERDAGVVRLELVGGRLAEVRVHRPLPADDAGEHLDEVRLDALAVREEPHPQQRGHAANQRRGGHRLGVREVAHAAQRLARRDVKDGLLHDRYRLS